MRVAAVLGDELLVLSVHGAQLAREAAEGIFGVFDAQVARLLEGGDGFVYAGYGDFVGLDVEVVDCVVDELERRWNVISSLLVPSIALSGASRRGLTVAGSSSRSILIDWCLLGLRMVYW